MPSLVKLVKDRLTLTTGTDGAMRPGSYTTIPHTIGLPAPKTFDGYDWRSEGAHV